MTLPQGFDMRHATQADAKAVTELANLSVRETLNISIASQETTHERWARPGFDLTTDSQCIVSTNGCLIGYADFYLHAAKCIANLAINVHPDYRDETYSEVLMNWAHQRAQAAMDILPSEMRFAIRSWLAEADKQIDLQTLFSSNGFEIIRYFNRMVISFEAAPPVAEFPAGITVRTFNRDADLRLVVCTEREVFRDHWDHFEAPFEEDLKWWSQRIDSIQDFDPTLWFLAMGGEEIAAICLCFPEERGNDEMGSVSILGVRRPWRHKGLGTALLHHSFGELYKRGKTQVTLMVDADSLTGALRLYERVGMHRTHSFSVFEKELRLGKDPTKLH